jgi:Ca-activated chloride channel homolog
MMRWPVALSWLVGIGLASGATAPQGQPPQGAFRSTTEVVLVDALVTRNGRPVEGLTAADFDVRDGGVRQTIQLVGMDRVPVDLRLVLDVSGSLEGQQLETLKSAARAAIAGLRPGDRAEVLTFSDVLQRRAGWTSDRAVLDREIERMSAAGWTALVDAVFTAMSLPEQDGRRTLGLVFTDGLDTSSWLSPADVVRSARQSRTILYGVTTMPVGSIRPDMVPRLRELLLEHPTAFRSAFLPVVVEETSGELLFTGVMNDLRATFVNVVSRFNQRYLLSYVPTGVPAAGWHTIDVQVKDKGLRVSARKGYDR